MDVLLVILYILPTLLSHDARIVDDPFFNPSPRCSLSHLFLSFACAQMIPVRALQRSSRMDDAKAIVSDMSNIRNYMNLSSGDKSLPYLS